MKTTWTNLAVAVSLLGAPAAAQQLNLPRPSPKATVSQTIGITDVSIAYSRPGVKGRTIWGELVPYNEVWRTGANENTTISFSHDVTVDGQPLPAGIYSVHTLPTEGTWTVIFSKNATLWGSFGYNPEDDALRLQVEPRSAAHQERLIFTIDNLSDDSAEVVLHWEKLQVPFTVKTAVEDAVLSELRSAVRWQTPYQAANYCFQNDVNLDQAMKWVDASLVLEENFWNLRLKASLLAKESRFSEAVALAEKALEASKTMAQPPPANLVSQLEGSIGEWKGKT